MRIFFSLTFQVLLLRVFGAGLQTDVYLLSLSSVEFIHSLFLGFILDFLIPIYNDVKVRNQEDAKKFVGGVIMLGGAVEIVMAFVIFITSPYIVKIFATGFTEEKIIYSSHLVRILIFSIPFSGINAVLNAILYANFFMFIGYLTALSLPIFNLTFLFFFVEKFGIEAIAYSVVASSIFNFFILIIYSTKKLDLRLQNPFTNRDVLFLLTRSIPTRIGGILYLLKGPITTNVLSFFPTGYLTIYKYALRIVAIVFEITNSPILNLFYAKASRLVSENKIGELKQALLSTIGNNTFLFISSLIPFILFFDKVFGLLFGEKVSEEDLMIMFHLFLILVLFYLVLSFEMFFVYITYTLKGGLKILQIAGTFIILFTLLLLIGVNRLGIYTLPIALVLSQSSNAIAYINYVNKKLSIIDYKILGVIFRVFIIVSLITGFNIFLGNNFFYRLYLNAVFGILWIILGWNKMISTFQYIIKKGEIK